MTPIQTNKPVFFNSEGEPLNGTIYIGQPDSDPRTNPKTVTFRDAGGVEFTASQPLRTTNGRIVYNGKPIVALVDGEYSMLVFDNTGVQVDYSRSINPEGGTGGGIADFSEVTRVGLTLSEIKQFDVAVGDTVENIGLLNATDGLRSEWVAVSNTGVAGNDETLIDFANGLQGRLLAKKPALIWSGPSSTTVNLGSLDGFSGYGQYHLHMTGFGFSGSRHETITILDSVDQKWIFPVLIDSNDIFFATVTWDSSGKILSISDSQLRATGSAFATIDTGSTLDPEFFAIYRL